MPPTTNSTVSGPSLDTTSGISGISTAADFPIERLMNLWRCGVPFNDELLVQVDDILPTDDSIFAARATLALPSGKSSEHYKTIHDDRFREFVRVRDELKALLKTDSTAMRTDQHQDLKFKCKSLFAECMGAWHEMERAQTIEEEQATTGSGPSSDSSVFASSLGWLSSWIPSRS